MKRLFIAIKIKPDADTLNTIYAIQKQLQNEPIKWVDTSGIHLTLKFLGDTEEDLIPKIEQALQTIAQTQKATTLPMKGIGVFPNRERPRVLWLGMETNNLLNQLVKRIENAMTELGFQPENRPFVPHITLGRIKFMKNTSNLKKILDKYQQRYFQDVQINEIILYESTLTPQGAKYTVIKKFELIP